MHQLNNSTDSLSLSLSHAPARKYSIELHPRDASFPRSRAQNYFCTGDKMALFRRRPCVFFRYLPRALKERATLKKERQIDGGWACTKCAFMAAANDELINKASLSLALGSGWLTAGWLAEKSSPRAAHSHSTRRKNWTTFPQNLSSAGGGWN